MARFTMVQAFDLVEMVINDAIQRQGPNARLPLDRDPSFYETSSGAHLRLFSNHAEHRRLSYSMIDATLRGLRYNLIDLGNFKEANFEIIVRGTGRVGGGRISPA